MKRAVALAVLLLAPTSVGWMQPGGGPDRAGFAVVTEGALDVLVVRSLLAPEERIRDGKFAGVGMAVTPHGLAMVSFGPEGCRLLVLDPDTLERRQDALLDGCQRASLEGYVPAHDLLLLCDRASAASPVLQARDARTGAPAWAIVPERDLGVPTDPSGVWRCEAPAYDAVRDEVVAAFSAVEASAQLQGTENRVAAIGAADGSILWRSAIPPVGALGPTRPSSLAPTSAGRFLTGGLTLTQTGVVVMVFYCPLACGAAFQPGIAWFDREGAFQDFYLAQFRTTDPGALTSRTNSASRAAAAEGVLAIAQLGGEAFLVNPEEAGTVANRSIDTVEAGAGGTYAAAPAWRRQDLVVPLRHSANLLDPADLSVRWGYTEGQERIVTQVLLDQARRIHVLTAALAGDERVRLVTLDLDKDVTQKLPLPQDAFAELANDAVELQRTIFLPRLTPLPDGRLVAFDANGTIALLGTARGGPSVEASDLRPAVGETVSLSIGAPGAQRVLVAWEDSDSVDVLAPGEDAHHAYPEAGPRAVHVTLVRADGTTATTVLRLDVGAPRLTPLQRAFAPEMQEWSFFVLGLLVTLVGAAFALVARRRRRGALRARLREIDGIRAAGAQDAAAGLVALQAFRARMRAALAAGHLEEAHFVVLDVRGTALQRALRGRVLAPLEAHASAGLRARVARALEDGLVSARELDEILESLAREALPADEKLRVERFLRDWAEADAA